MDYRPIGIFDSGLGGLNCITSLLKQTADERVIYFGDTARTPYGSKAVSTIRTYTYQIADFLASQDVKMMVIACNTITATCLPELQERFPTIPILGIIEPAARAIGKMCNENNHIGVIATKVTTESGLYPESIARFAEGKRLKVYAKATPLLVPLIEEGIIDDEIMDLTIDHYLKDFIAQNQIDTLVLGCTHYPLIRQNIQRLYPQLTIINPCYEMGFRVKEVLSEKNLLAVRAGDTDATEQENIFYASDLSENFINMIQKVLETEKSDLNLKFKNLEI